MCQRPLCHFVGGPRSTQPTLCRRPCVQRLAMHPCVSNLSYQVSHRYSGKCHAAVSAFRRRQRVFITLYHNHIQQRYTVSAPVGKVNGEAQSLAPHPVKFTPFTF